jgi:hypothetical protein
MSASFAPWMSATTRRARPVDSSTCLGVAPFDTSCSA